MVLCFGLMKGHTTHPLEIQNLAYVVLVINSKSLLKGQHHAILIFVLDQLNGTQNVRFRQSFQVYNSMFINSSMGVKIDKLTVLMAYMSTKYIDKLMQGD